MKIDKKYIPFFTPEIEIADKKFVDLHCVGDGKYIMHKKFRNDAAICTWISVDTDLDFNFLKALYLQRFITWTL